MAKIRHILAANRIGNSFGKAFGEAMIAILKE